MGQLSPLDRREHRSQITFNLPELGTDRCHRTFRQKECHDRRHHQYRHERTRHLTCNLRHIHRDQHGHDRNSHGIPVHGIYSPEISTPFTDKTPRHVRQCQSQRTRYLRGENRQRNAGSKTDNQRVRNKLQQSPQPQHTEPDHDHSGKYRRNNHPVQTVIIHNPINDNDKSTRGTTNLYPATTKERNEKPGHNSRYNSLFRRNTRGHGKSDCQR